MKKYFNFFLVVILAAVFTFAVAYAQNTGSVKVTWTDELNPADSLAMYKVYYSTISGDYSGGLVEEVNDVTLREYVIDGFEPNITYYFVMVAVSKNGIESNYSNEASVILGKPHAPQALEAEVHIVF